MGIGLGTVLSGLQGVGQGVLGFQQGRQQEQAHEAAIRQQMIKDALEMAARRQTQSNADRTFGLEQGRAAENLRHNKALEGKQTPQQQISARVNDLVGQGVPLLEASRQARQEAGRTTPYAPFSPEYIASVANLTKAREAAKPPRAQRGTASDPNSPLKASQRERYLSQIATRAVEAAGGDVNQAGAILLQQPETANIFTQGLNASHLSAAAAIYKLRTMGKAGSSAPSTLRPQSPTSKGALTDLVTPPSPRPQATTRSQQQQDWDEAAAALRASGQPTRIPELGPRPQR